MLTWLEEEMFAASFEVRRAHIDRIVACGVPLEAIAQLGVKQPQFGIAAIREEKGSLYSPDPDGAPAVIMPVFDCGEVIDLIAFKSSRPANWRWRIGHGWALGADLLDGDNPVRVVRTPIEWLAEAGDAFAVLDWEAPAQCWREVQSAPPLIVADELLQHRLQRAIIASIPMPAMETHHAA